VLHFFFFNARGNQIDLDTDETMTLFFFFSHCRWCNWLRHCCYCCGTYSRWDCSSCV